VVEDGFDARGALRAYDACQSRAPNVNDAVCVRYGRLRALDGPTLCIPCGSVLGV
jgi:hypothetical protein